MNVPEVIIFLSGVTKYIPKNTVVCINGVKFSVGPSGVNILPDTTEPNYRVMFEHPIEINWKTVIQRMTDNSLCIYAGGGDTNIAPALSLIIRSFGLHK